MAEKEPRARQNVYRAPSRSTQQKAGPQRGRPPRQGRPDPGAAKPGQTGAPRQPVHAGGSAAGQLSYRRFAARKKRRRRLRRAGGMAVFAVALGAAAFLLVHIRGAAETIPVSAAGEPKTGTAALPEAERFVIAVDPGHNGCDVGCSDGNRYERTMTWATANELVTLLDADGRFAPFLTITEQESTDPGAPRVKPSERAARAADRGAQLLVSIHGNADPVYDASGFECFPVPPGREYYAQSLDLAQRIVDGFSAGGANIRGVNGVRFMYFDDDDNEHFVESTDATVNYNSTYTVLEDAPCPAVLTEQCFLTNAADFDRFGDEDGCRLSAQILYDAICAWYEAGGAEK